MRVLEEGGGGKKGRRFCSGKIRRDWAFYTMHHYPPTPSFKSRQSSNRGENGNGNRVSGWIE